MLVMGCRGYRAESIRGEGVRRGVGGGGPCSEAWRVRRTDGGRVTSSGKSQPQPLGVTGSSAFPGPAQ